ncbi:DNA primase family protein [Pseudogulbenkiania subflava]|uniref:Putative DNA primase/helicase n=1 Tax=Pseudogulbenkiania subflava DSM 22618 TaxID=1123014 RepID=A0A1Y6C9A7_9NEIS|nr:DNA primase family protein [Pseudogulbenkiania subflava]SMF52440.1 putative DNA primase/helicase [Pseudogulbenkiania subflava DSM 22618]
MQNNTAQQFNNIISVLPVAPKPLKWNHVPASALTMLRNVIQVTPKAAAISETYMNELRPYFANGGDGRIWYYDGAKWCVESDLDAETKISELIRDVGGKPTRNLVPGLQFELTRLSQRVPESASGINVANGFLQCVGQQWVLTPHHKNYGQRYQLPFDYDPQATCPLWMSFLERMQPSEEVRRYLQNFFGWVVLGHNRPHEEKFAIWLGDGANGKSVAIGVLKALVGDENAATLSLNELNGKSVELLANKLVNVGSETERTERVETAILKKLVSGEPVLATPKYRHHYTMTCNTALVFAVNDVPVIDDRSGGTWRRLMLVEWPVTLEEHERDKKLQDKLAQQELPGILNWALEGALRVLEEGLVVPTSVTASGSRLRQENNAIALFVEDAVQLHKEAVIAKGDLYKAFKLWCLSHGHKVMSEVNFGKELRRLKLDLRDAKTPAGYVDIEGYRLNSRLNAYRGLMIPAERISREIQHGDGPRLRTNNAIGQLLVAANDEMAY